MLRIKNITKQFRDKKILDNVTIEVKRGEIAVLLGASGVGKSTILRILNNLETIDHGQVFLDEQPLELDKVNSTHTVGMVFQHFNLFDHLTVEKNITLALEKTAGKSPQEAKKIALDLLDQYGLREKRYNYPAQLSGGQKQRLAIARSLALKPKILCLDEPTSALDPLLTSYVAKTIEHLAQEGYIVLVATHDTTLLEKLPCTIYLMKDGTIVEKASSHNFYAHPEQYPALKKFIEGTY